MAGHDSLPPDQRAVLQLVLGRGQSYDEIAAMLSIDRAGVRSRALDALDALGPESAVDSVRRGLITDYLLGQLPAPVADEVRRRLAAQPGERAWARVVAGELMPLAGDRLPEIPSAVAAPVDDSAPGEAERPKPARGASQLTDAEMSAVDRRIAQRRRESRTVDFEDRRRGTDRRGDPISPPPAPVSAGRSCSAAASSSWSPSSSSSC